MAMFLGMAAGSWVMQSGTGVQDYNGVDVLFDAMTHDAFPAGPQGLCQFRSVDVTIGHDSGYNIGVTPIVDGVARAEQTFQAPAGTGSSGLAHAECPAFFHRKGTSIALRVRMIAATGTVELVSAGYAFIPLRQAP